MTGPLTPASSALLKYFIRTVIVVLILAALLLAFIQTPLAKRMICGAIIRATRSSDGGGVVIGSISGFIPFDFRIGDFRIRDGSGDWLVAEDTAFRVSPGALFLFRLRAEEVVVKRASLLRLPRGRGKDEGRAKEGAPFTLRSLPSFRVDLLSVESVRVEEPVLGEQIVATMTGRGLRTNSEKGGTANLSLRRIDGKTGWLELSAESGVEFSPLTVNLRIEEGAGGSLGGLGTPGSPGPLSFSLQGEGPLKKWKVDLRARLVGQGNITADLLFDLTQPLASGTIEAEFKTLPGEVRLEQGRLSARFTVADGAQNISAKIRTANLALPFGRAGGVEVTAEIKDLLRAPRGTVDVEASKLHYPGAEEKGPGVEVAVGEITGHLSLSSSNQRPAAELELLLADCAFPGAPAGLLEPLEITIAGRLKDDRLHLSLDSGEQGGFILKAAAEVPVKFSLDPISLQLPGDETISGKLRTRVDLELLSSRLALTHQSIRGIVNADLSAGGTLEKPELTGKVKMEKGRYRNLNTGTALNGVTLEIETDRDRVSVKQLSAATPGHGKVGLTGWLELSPRDFFPYSFSLEMAAAEVIDLEVLTAVCSGKVLLEGSLEEGRLAGTVKIERAEGRIPKTPPTTVPEIKVTELNKPGGVPLVQEPSAPAPFLNKIALDLHVTAPEKLAVKGRGLDSEWKTDITVQGTAARPRVSGGVSLLSGIFIFMGEELEMEDCGVTMDGRFPPVPQLKINMKKVKSDITINLQVIGPVTAPEVILSSQPPYPTDEILAQLLYGRSASRLTGIQALKIASGLRTLQGKEGLFDLLTGWTSFLGDIQVDLTELEGSTDQTAVRVRWSVNRNIYIENQRAIDDKGNVFIGRWDLTRHLQLNIQSGYGVLGDSSYLLYQWDY